VQEEDGIEVYFEEDFAKLLAEVRHCKYCQTRLTHVIRGLPQEGDVGLEHEFLEFWGGCIIGPTDEDWYCKFCGAKVIESNSMKRGACLLELPTRLQQALDTFVSRLRLLVEPADESDLYELISLTCPLGSANHEHPDLEEHESDGDYLKVRVCSNFTFKFFLDGRAVQERLILDDSMAPSIEEREERNEFESSAFREIGTKIVDLIFEQEALGIVATTIAEANIFCDKYLCGHDSSWDLLTLHYFGILDGPDEWLEKPQEPRSDE
jgi:hypothetical protein